MQGYDFNVAMDARGGKCRIAMTACPGNTNREEFRPLCAGWSPWRARDVLKQRAGKESVRIAYGWDILNAAKVNANSRILRRRISANLLPIQVEFCVCKIPLNIRASTKLTNLQPYTDDFIPGIGRIPRVNRLAIDLCYIV